MQCLVAFQHNLHGQYLTQGKEKAILKSSSQKKLFTSASTHTELQETNTIM